jgi:hypothetical protein
MDKDPLGLQAALRSYEQGVQWRRGEEQIARQQAQKQAIDASNKAATGVIEQSKAEWALNGAQGEYRPNSQTLFRAAEARGAALAKAGLWDQFLENEARVAPMRLRTRADALQQYQIDGDVDKLARQVYPTLFDGKTIKGSEYIEGADAVMGLPARSKKLQLTLSDGTNHVLDPQQLVAQIKLSLDPDALKREAMLNFERAKADAEAQSKIIVEREKGSQARQTEGVKGENKRRELETGHKYGLELADVNNAAAQRRTTTTANATLGSARLGADARRYAADLGLAAAKERSSKDGSGPGGTGKRLSTKERLTMVEDSFGDLTQGGWGSKRVGSAATAKIVEGMEAYLRQYPDASESEAMNAAAAKMGFKATAKAD